MPSVTSETQGLSSLVRLANDRGAQLEPPVSTDADLWLVTNEGDRKALGVLTVKEVPRAIVREHGRVALLGTLVPGALKPEKFCDQGEKSPPFDQDSFDLAVLFRHPTAEEKQESPYRSRTREEIQADTDIGTIASKVFELLEIVEVEETTTPAGVVLLRPTGDTEPYIDR